MASQWQELMSDGSSMPAWVSVPDGPGPFPGVVVAQHAGGVDEFVKTMTDRLAEQGYIAIAPALFHRQPDANQEYIDSIPKDAERIGKLVPFIQKLRDEEIIRDLKTSIAAVSYTHLRAHET